MNRARHLSIAAALTILTTVVVYLLITGQVIGFGLLQLPTAASEEAATIDALIGGHIVLMAFLFAVIVAPALYSIIVFRRREGDDSDAPHIHGNTAVEIAWTVIPVLLVIGFAIWGVNAYNTVIAAEPNEHVVRAQGFKWDWNFYYPEHDNKVDASLVVEVGQPVVLEMQSRDVIHAFWVPHFRVKQDVSPFNVNNRDLDFSNADYSADAAGYIPQVVRFTPTREGVFRVRCAEICGTNHYAMLAHVHVLSSQDYQAWVNGELTLPSDPNQTNSQQFNQDGSVNSVYYLPELEQYCQDKYGDANCQTD
ncbi:MAG: cytochrome c oxidase subunit II [Anaerolineales bacterium]|nr:cytochrome c oxidase subunit II [Anaerolineales bacterium]